MGNNTTLTLTADIADLKVKMAAAQAVMKETAKAANDAAKAVAMGDGSDAGRTKLLATTQAAVAAKGAFNGLAREYKNLDATEKQTAASGAQFLQNLKEQAATAGMSQKQMLAYRAEQLGVAEDAAPLIAALRGQTTHMVSSRAATEGLVLVHEALSGRYTRMTGSAMILGQALIGQTTISSVLTAAMSPLGIAIIGTAAAAGFATYEAIKYEEAQRELLATTVGLGAASGLSAEQIQAAANVASTASGQSASASLASAQAFAQAGIKSSETIAGLSAQVQTYAALTGQTAADAQKTLAEAMKDPIKGAETLNAQLGILDSTQQAEIKRLDQQGDRTGAVNIVMKALKERTDQANAAGVGVNTTWQNMGATLSDLTGALGRAASAMGHFIAASGKNPDVALADTIAEGQRLAKARQATADAQRQAQLNDASSKGGAIYDTTPEAKDAAQRTALAGSMKVLQTALSADTQLHGAHSEAVQHDQAAIAAYKRAIDTFLPSAEKAHRLAVLDQQLAEAKKGRNATKIADLTRQKSEVETAGQVMSPDVAQQRANDAAATAADRSPAPKKAKDDRVAKWTEELRAQEIASNDFFADETAKELTFWQGKVSATTKGSAAWLAVQGHVFEASKALARQDYQDHIADLNERIAADRNNWTKLQADLQEKVAYIKGKQGEQSRDLTRSLQEQQTAEREHNDRMQAEAQRAAKETTDELKRSLEAQQRAREEAAKASEVGIKSNAGATPFGDIKADQQIAAQQQQLIRAKMADNDVFHADEAQRLADNITTAATKYSQDVDAYRAAIAAKKAEDQRYADTKRTLDQQLVLEQQQAVAQMKSKYESYIQGTVSTTVSGLDKMISGQMTWRQFGVSIYQSVAREAEQQVTKMATNWIVQHVLMSAAQKAQLAAQTAAQATTMASQTAMTVASSKAQVVALAGLAGAGGVASMAAAPFPLDMTAPAFGTSMASAALALGSFAQGTNIVPNDMIAQIHAGEAIIPKADNTALRAVAERGAAGRDGAKGGDMHLHYNPTVNGQLPFKDQLAAHEDNIVSMLQNAARRGVRFSK